MGKLKIALLCNGYGKVMRGSEQFTYQFYNQLKAVLEIDIYGIGKTDHSIQIKSKFRDSFKIPWRNGRAYLESFYFGKAGYRKMIGSGKRYDLIFNNAGLGGSFWSKKYRKKTKTPFITRARGGGREEKINYLFKPDCMIFLTKENMESTRKFLPKVNTIVIPNAINLNEYKKEKKQSKLIEDLERPIYLGTSAFERYKRNDLIIKALSKINSGSLLLLGDGSLKNETVDFGKKLLGSRFRYGGIIPHSNRAEIINLYKNVDIFVQAARKEAFGVVFLEAMASNIPVVTQKDTRRKEIVGDAGILINCEDIDEFAKALSEAAERKWDNIPLSQSKKYDWEVIKKEYFDIIKEILK